jgi:hypothetical protein
MTLGLRKRRKRSKRGKRRKTTLLTAYPLKTLQI